MRFLLLVTGLCGFVSADHVGGLNPLNATQEKARALYHDIGKSRETNKHKALDEAREARSLIDTVPRSLLDIKLYLGIYTEISHLEWGAGNMSATNEYVNKALTVAGDYGAENEKRGFELFQAKIAAREDRRADSIGISKKVLQESLQAKDDEHAVSALDQLSQNASDTGDFASGIKYLHQELDISAADNDPLHRARMLSRLASFYIEIQDYNRALAENDSALLLIKDIENKSVLASLLIQGSNIYSYLNDTDKAMKYLNSAEGLAKSIGSENILMRVEINLSDDLLAQKNYPLALEKAELGLALAKKVGGKYSVATALINRGTALNHMGRHTEGLADIEAGFKYFIDTKSAPDIVEVLGSAADEYAVAGDYKTALNYEKRFKVMDDDVFHGTHAKATAELEAQYAYAQQQHEIATLMNERRHHTLVRNFSFMIGVGMILLVILVSNRHNILVKNQDRLKLAKERLEKLAYTDPLTGLHNRRYFFEYVRPRFEDIGQSPEATAEKPTEHKDLTFYIIDLDHFKCINDGHGHYAGDAVLKQTVERLSRVIRDSDELIRWGGEEFLFVARHSDRNDASVVAERLRSVVEAEPFDVGEGRLISCTCSIGYAFYPFSAGMAHLPQWEAVVALADQALYEAKSSGRNGWIGATASRQAAGGTIELSSSARLHELVKLGLCEIQSSFVSATCAA